ncbi:GNAT family N-acetyltransferase [Shouchella clausii]|uniref:GNAT family N-acetyltransferase n=1 Tax=Shouchella clausii TaxID=79880 RepID=UPI0039833078
MNQLDDLYEPNWENTANKLMEYHVEALFVHDQHSRLLTINENLGPTVPAPAFFLGRTIDGKAVCRFRYDVTDKTAKRLQELSLEEPSISEFPAKPKYFAEYMALLHGQQYTMGPCYFVPRKVTSSLQVKSLTRENAANWLPHDFEWLIRELDVSQPCVALVHQNIAVSICRSVRITNFAHEAGIETLKEYRGNGFAPAVVVAWAIAVRKLGCLPLYSTLAENHSSKSVASKLGLAYYGSNFTIA